MNRYYRGLKFRYGQGFIGERAKCYLDTKTVFSTLTTIITIPGKEAKDAVLFRLQIRDSGEVLC